MCFNHLFFKSVRNNKDNHNTSCYQPNNDSFPLQMNFAFWYEIYYLMILFKSKYNFMDVPYDYDLAEVLIRLCLWFRLYFATHWLWYHMAKLKLFVRCCFIVGLVGFIHFKLVLRQFQIQNNENNCLYQTKIENIWPPKFVLLS